MIYPVSRVNIYSARQAKTLRRLRLIRSIVDYTSLEGGLRRLRVILPAAA